jgi:hypothetical protein
VVGLPRTLERCYPHRLDPQLRHVSQAGSDPRQVAYTIPVAVRERARVDLVDDGLASSARTP